MIYAISDLHLALSCDKPMDIFGSHWRDHEKKMAKNWDAIVTDEDIVLCPGDLSWAMRLKDVKVDLDWIAARKGQKKILMRGNHDYWWNSISKVRQSLPETLYALQNDAVDLGNVVLAGSRAWDIPHPNDLESKRRKIYERELQRFSLSLQAAKKIASSRPIIAMLHYPPFVKNHSETGFTDLCAKYAVHTCIFGHLHGENAHAETKQGLHKGTNYSLVAADYLNFSPILLM